MATIYVLVGLPGSGKTTWAHDHFRDAAIFSSDDYRERLFNTLETTPEQNKEVFGSLYSDLFKRLNSGHDCVYDATNTSRKDRRRVLSNVRKEHRKIAIYFDVSVELAKKRNQQRVRQVSDEVIDHFFNKLTPPTVEEGFDNIIRVC